MTKEQNNNKRRSSMRTIECKLHITHTLTMPRTEASVQFNFISQNVLLERWQTAPTIRICHHSTPSSEFISLQNGAFFYQLLLLCIPSLHVALRLRLGSQDHRAWNTCHSQPQPPALHKVSSVSLEPQPISISWTATRCSSHPVHVAGSKIRQQSSTSSISPVQLNHQSETFVSSLESRK